MYCSGCGSQLRDVDRFCPACGRPTGEGSGPPSSSPEGMRRLVRPMYEKSIGGVCAGFARYLGVDVTLLRVLWLCTAIFLVGTGFLVYLVCWIVIPADYSGGPATAQAAAEPAAARPTAEAGAAQEPSAEPGQG